MVNEPNRENQHTHCPACSFQVVTATDSEDTECPNCTYQFRTPWGRIQDALKVNVLEAKLEAYRWVPVGERLPDTNRKVSTTNKRRIWDDRYYPSKKYWNNSTDGVVEYWRETNLPE